MNGWDWSLINLISKLSIAKYYWNIQSEERKLLHRILCLVIIVIVVILIKPELIEQVTGGILVP